MEPTHQIILESLPPKSPRSKLEPHRELIRELRRKGRTYREVALLFHQRLGLYVAPSTLHSFVKVRAKHRKQSQFELPPKQAVGLSKSGLAVFEVYKQNPREPQFRPSAVELLSGEPACGPERLHLSAWLARTSG